MQQFGADRLEQPVSQRGPELLQLRGLTKTFGATQALRSVDLDFKAGEIHALVGQNGAGKSTLIKILAGYVAPDEGRVVMRGQPMHLPVTPRVARTHGLTFVHQDLGLVPDLSVLENIRVGRYRTAWGGRLRWRAERAEVSSWLTSMDLGHINPNTPVRDLSQAERALIALVRALQDIHPEHGGILVLDEPTAHLPGSEVERLYQILREVAARGIAVIFVSHRLDEVLAICDRISVLRDGQLVGSVPRQGTTEHDLIAMILGRDLGGLYPSRHEPEREQALQVRGLMGQIVDNIDIDVTRGEVIGLTGILGMGHDEVPYLLFGATRATGGVISRNGRSVLAQEMTPHQARHMNLAFLPADRQGQGGVPTATLLENLTMPDLGQYFQGGRLQHRRERTEGVAALREFEVRPPDPERLLSTLSGGNQQKTVLGKWLRLKPDILLLHEPTQGVDIGSRKQIFRFIRDIADTGTSVIIASSEHEDLANVCHRVLVFRRGRIAQELSGENLTLERVVEQSYRSR